MFRRERDFFSTTEPAGDFIADAKGDDGDAGARDGDDGDDLQALAWPGLAAA